VLIREIRVFEGFKTVKMKINVKRKFQKIVNGHTEGYSLIELIMVIVMTGIITAVALPRLSGFSGVDAYSAARQVKSDIRYTQELAISKFRKTKITFDADADPGTYVITSSGPTLNRALPPSSKATFNAVGDGTTGLMYTFNSYGEPDITTDVDDTLRISTPGGDKDITVRAMTGRAAIQ
jgi:MSHA pilin protein MshC